MIKSSPRSHTRLTHQFKYKLKRCSKKECCKQCRYVMFKGTMTKTHIHAVYTKHSFFSLCLHAEEELTFFRISFLTYLRSTAKLLIPTYVYHFKAHIPVGINLFFERGLRGERSQIITQTCKFLPPL